MQQYYDYESAAREASLDADDLAQLDRDVRADFPNDDILFELHMLRACRPIAQGRTTLAAIRKARETARP